VGTVIIICNPPLKILPTGTLNVLH